MGHVRFCGQIRKTNVPASFQMEKDANRRASVGLRCFEDGNKGSQESRWGQKAVWVR